MRKIQNDRQLAPDRVRLARNAIIACGVALNLLASIVTQRLGLPSLLDTTGTLLAAFECGPLAAILTALASSTLGLAFSRTPAYFAIVNVCVALSASRMFYRNVLKRRGGFFIFVLTLSLISGVLGGIVILSLNSVINSGFVPLPLLEMAGPTGPAALGRFRAMMIGRLLFSFADKTVSTAFVLAVAHFLPAQLREQIQALDRAEDPEHFDLDRQHRRILVALVVEAVALVAICTWISVAIYTENARSERVEIANGAAQQVVKALNTQDLDSYQEHNYATREYAVREDIIQGIRDSMPYLKYIYVYRIEENGYRVVFDAVPPGETPDAPGMPIPSDPSLEPYLPALQAGETLSPIESDGEYGWLLSVYRPIRDRNGACTAFVGVDVSMENLWHYVQDFLLRVTLIVSAFLLFILSVGVWMAGNYRRIINRQVEQIREAKEEAEAANRAKSGFLANMSHEIRTPINAVLGMDEMILRESGDEDILLYAENIKTAGTTLLGLINDILDLSKIEAGKMEIMPADYNLFSVLNDLVNMIEVRAESKGLLFRIDFDDTAPRRLHGDEVRIKQVITNILTNAVKYTERGSVTFRVRYERIADDPESVFLDVSVTDTGIGIKPEEMKKLCNAYERIEEMRNRGIEGTGLGMSITGSLLDMMGSTLQVESVYGEGSTFSFRLRQRVVSWEPLGDYEAAYRASVRTRKRYRESFTAPDAAVLVIDDLPMNVEVFKSFLKRTRVQIDTAGSGDEGLALAGRSKYDVIFLDHMMPGKDGIETLHELRAAVDGPNLRTPVVCLTANAISGAREQYLGEGFDDYLTKPIDPGLLEEMLLRYLPPEKCKAPAEDAGTSPAPADPHEALPEWLWQIDGLSVEDGIRRCGTAETWLEALTIYGRNAAAAADEIEGFWRAGDLDNTTVKVHAVKSLSRTIGAEGIGALAEKLEQAGKAGDAAAVGAELDTLLTQIRSVSDALAPLCREPAGASADDESLPPISEEELREAFDSLREFSAGLDAEGAAYVFTYLAGFRIPADERERVEKLRRAIEGFDWEQAETLLKMQL